MAPFVKLSSFAVCFFLESPSIFRFDGSLRARGPMSTRGQREAARTQAHVLTGRVRRWEKRWIRGGESSPDVLRWTPVVDANGRDVESAKNEKRDAFEVVPLAECVLAAAAKPTAHDAVAAASTHLSLIHI